MGKKIKIEINSIENLRDLLQETYNLADEQLVQAQNEINKLANSTKLQDEVMEYKAKYAKAMNDYLGIKDKAISRKIEIAKLMSEIFKQTGNEKEYETSMGTFNFDNIRELLDQGTDSKNENIKLNK